MSSCQSLVAVCWKIASRVNTAVWSHGSCMIKEPVCTSHQASINACVQIRNRLLDLMLKITREIVVRHL